MKSLRRMSRYNAWANRRVFEICSKLDPALLDDKAAGTVGTISGTLKHLGFVEDRFLALLRGLDPETELGDRAAYVTRELRWFAERQAAIAEGYERLLAERDAVFLDTKLAGTRWDFLTAGDALVQVFTHSVHHRAQVLSALGAHGMAVPDLDYLLMLREAHEATAPSR